MVKVAIEIEADDVFGLCIVLRGLVAELDGGDYAESSCGDGYEYEFIEGFGRDRDEEVGS